MKLGFKKQWIHLDTKMLFVFFAIIVGLLLFIAIFVFLPQEETKIDPNKDIDYGAEFEAPIDSSNVMLVCPHTGEPTRIGIRRDEDGQRFRYSKKSGQDID